MTDIANFKHARLVARSLKDQADALAELFLDNDPDRRNVADSDEVEGSPTDEGRLEGLPNGVSSILKDNYVKSLGFAGGLESLAVKSIGKDEIRGYSHLWGSDRLTDIEVEYFTRSTDFWDKVLGKSARPLTWDHAQDEEFKASPVIGQIVDFGDDEVGRWYIARLDRSHRYIQAVDALIKAGRLGTSSDSAPQYVERIKTGKSTWLKTWPFFAAALTDQPCEPRMLTDGSPEFLKSLGITLPDAPGTDTARQLEILQLRTRLLKLKEQ